MGCLKRGLVAMGVGITLLIGLTNCVVVPAGPGPSAYVIPPPAVVIRPYRLYRPYRPYYPHRPHRPYAGYRHYGYRW